MFITSYNLSNAFGRPETAVLPHAQLPLKYGDFRSLFWCCPGHLPVAALGCRLTLRHPYVLSLQSICQTSRCCPLMPTGIAMSFSRDVLPTHVLIALPYSGCLKLPCTPALNVLSKWIMLLHFMLHFFFYDSRRNMLK